MLNCTIDAFRTNAAEEGLKGKHDPLRVIECPFAEGWVPKAEGCNYPVFQKLNNYEVIT